MPWQLLIAFTNFSICSLYLCLSNLILCSLILTSVYTKVPAIECLTIRATCAAGSCSWFPNSYTFLYQRVYFFYGGFSGICIVFGYKATRHRSLLNLPIFVKNIALPKRRAIRGESSAQRSLVIIYPIFST
jgi:hypothetical protein